MIKSFVHRCNFNDSFESGSTQDADASISEFYSRGIVARISDFRDYEVNKSIATAANSSSVEISETNLVICKLGSVTGVFITDILYDVN